MANNLPNIALVGNAPQEQCGMLNAMLAEEELTDICDIILYGADGQPDSEALEDAIADWHDGKIDGIACLPLDADAEDIMRESLQEEKVDIVRLYVNDKMKMSSIMGDMEPLEAEARATKNIIIAKVKQVASVLKSDFFVLSPRIAVIAKEDDEENIVAAAVKELIESGVQAFGPFPADTFFVGNDYSAYDAVVSMCESMLKDDFFNITSGETLLSLSGSDVPIVMTDYEDTLRAIFTVIDIARNKKEYAKPFANPLPKLYKERREDGDKARFAMKKKGFNPAEHRRENIKYTTATTQNTQA